jgi:LacI family transcriptional regulator
VLPGNYLKHPFYGNIVSGALDVMLEEHFGLLVSHEMDDQIVFPPFVDRGDVDGLICYGSTQRYQNALPRLRRQTMFGQRPIVFINRASPDDSSVVFDDRAGGYALMSHLFDMGHRHVLHAYEDASYAYEQRLLGCRQAYRDHHLEPDAFLHNIFDWFPPHAPGDPNRLSTCFPAILQQTQATAIIARYDQHAQEMYQRLLHLGMHVPEDISLIGYNDTDTIFNERGENILTTVRLPLTEMGQQAARFMVQRVTGQRTESAHIVLPVELVIRQSVAPPSR